MEKLLVLLPPFLICIVLTGIHGYLGIHVLARHVIFVDLAMAQIAALGTTFAFLYGHDPYSLTAYFVSLGFTLLGAAVFALTRTRHDRVPQEATIGLVYAIATAAAILLADRAAHGTEHLKNLLAGSVVWVTWPQILKTSAIYCALGAFHFVYRERFLQISTDPEKAAAQGINVRLWDFLFYATFGVIIASSVQIAGILLVFCYLIAPAVFAVQFAQSLGARLIIGWSIGIVVSALGLILSYDANLPSGPAIIAVFAGFLLVSALTRYVKNAAKPLFALGKATLVLMTLWVGYHGLVRFLDAEQEHTHGAPEHPTGDSQGDLLHALGDEHDNVRAAACEKLGKMQAKEAIPKLRELLIEDPAAAVKEKAAIALGVLRAQEAIADLRLESEKENEDEWVQFHAAESLALLGDSFCFRPLFRLAYGAKTPALRDEALQWILQISDSESQKMLSMNPSDRLVALAKVFESWKRDPGSVRWNASRGRFEFP